MRVPFGVPAGNLRIQEARDFPPGSLVIKPTDDGPAEWFIFLRSGDGRALLFVVHAPARNLSKGDLVRCAGDLAGTVAGVLPENWSIALRPETARQGPCAFGRYHVGGSGELLLARMADREIFAEAREAAGLRPQPGLMQMDFPAPIVLEGWRIDDHAIYEEGIHFDWMLRVCGSLVEED